MRALEYLMNFRTNKAVLGSTNQDIKKLRENVTGIGSSFNKVHSELTKFAHSQKWMNITSLTQNVAHGVFGVAKSLKTVFSTSLNFMDNLASEGDKVAKSARLVGLSVKDYQAFAFAAERSGMALETFDSGMKKFSANLGKARSGDKTANSMFKALLPGKLSDYKSEREILLAMSDSYTKLSAAQKTFVSQQMFGLRATQFGELLGGGSAGVDSLLKKYEALGGGFDEETTKKAETFKDLMTDIKVTMESFKILVGSELLPVFNELFESISKYFVENRGELRKIFSDFGKQFVGGLKQMIPLLPSIISGIATIFSYVGKIVDYIGPVKTLIGVGILGSLGSIIGIVTSLAGLIGGPTLVAITGVAILFGEVYSIIKQIYNNWDMLTGAISDWWSEFKMQCVGIFEWIAEGFENAIGKGVSNGIRKAVKSVPLFGNMIFSDVKFDQPTGSVISDDDIKEMEQFKNRTITNKFSVDFKNMPRGVKVTAPKSGDFDYSYGYVLDGGV
jgi:hypothetical protein